MASLPVNCFIHPAGRPINTSWLKVLRRPVESAQYASEDFRRVLAEYGITASMSQRGNCWDNACSETLFGSLKVERLHGQRFVTRRQAKDEVIDWMLWYNRSWLHSTLAYVSPMRFEKDWHAAQAKQANS